MTETFNKLVRDRIPDIIRKHGDFPKTKILDNEEYFVKLNQKLIEEVAEYMEDYSINELVDIFEVVMAISEYKGVSKEEFERMRINKIEERGGFKDKVELLEVERNNS
jgi:predicted house-cleaning noncanonical NTP pyrophosphatase (MazG superfamily)